MKNIASNYRVNTKQKKLSKLIVNLIPTLQDAFESLDTHKGCNVNFFIMLSENKIKV